MGRKTSARHSRSDFFGNQGIHWDREGSGCPSTDSVVIVQSLFRLWFLPLPHVGATRATAALAGGDCRSQMNKKL